MAAFIIFGIMVLLFIWANTGKTKTNSKTKRKSVPTPYPTYTRVSENEVPIQKTRENLLPNEKNASSLKRREEWKKELRNIQIELMNKKVVENPSRYKSNWLDYFNLLEDKNIKTLYHFTDKSNLHSIKRHGGLYSWNYCLENNIEIPVPGGGELSHNLDLKKGLHNYVRVSFTSNHPMKYVPPSRAKNCIILTIDPEVIFLRNTKYANKNATRNDVNVGSTINDFNKIKFEIVKLKNHFDLDEETKPFYQAEILVLQKIPLEYISNLEFLLNKDNSLSDLPF